MTPTPARPRNPADESARRHPALHPKPVLVLAGLLAGATPALPADPPDPLRLHDPSTIVRCGGSFWTFHTGRGVGSRFSTNLVTWSRGPSVFAAPPAWVASAVPGNRGHFWAPDILQVGDRYLLYYSVSTWGKNTSAIALASASTLDPADPRYGWKDEGVVQASVATNDFNAIDPAVAFDDDGRLWMAFGSFWSGIKLVELDPATGRRLDPNATPVALATHPQIEAPGLLVENGWCYLFVNWGFCCRGTNSTYELRVGRSRSMTGPYLDREGRSMAEGGGSPFLASEGRFIGPGHAAFLREGTHLWMSCHYYDREHAGTSRLAIRRLDWDADDWPRAGTLRTPETPASGR